jgi:hypothetical protein
MHRLTPMRHWLLAPCAVLKERPRPPGSAHTERGPASEESRRVLTVAHTSRGENRRTIGVGASDSVSIAARPSGAGTLPRGCPCCQPGSVVHDRVGEERAGRPACRLSRVVGTLPRPVGTRKPAGDPGPGRALPVPWRAAVTGRRGGRAGRGWCRVRRSRLARVVVPPRGPT